MRLIVFSVLALIAIITLLTYTWVNYYEAKSTKTSTGDSARAAVIEPSKGVTPTDSPLTSKQKLFQASFSLESPKTGTQELWLTLKDLMGRPVKEAEVKAEPWMPEHRHGSPTDPVVEEREPGLYRIYPLDFTMPGTWQVRISISAGGQTDSLVPAFAIE